MTKKLNFTNKKKVNDSCFFFFSVFFLLSFFLISNLNIYNLNTFVMDLGIFSNQVYNLKKEWWRAFAGHFHPFSYFFSLISDFKTLIPYFLINFQNLILVFTFLLIKKIYGKTLSIFFLLSPLLWFSFKDFHYDSIVVLLHSLVFLFYYKKKIKTAYFFLTLSCFVKEIFTLYAIFFMIFFSIEKISKEKKISSIFYEILIILIYVFLYFFQYYISYILIYETKDINHHTNYSNLFTEIVNSKVNLLSNMNINFLKIKFILLIFSFFLFLPLLNLKKIILIIPLILTVLIFQNQNYFDYTNHYTIGILIPLIDICYEIKKKYELDKLLLLFGFIFNIFFSYSPISRFFWFYKIEKFYFLTYIPNDRNIIIKKALIENISENKIISSQNSLNYHKISNAHRLFPFPEAVIKPHTIISKIDGRVFRTEVIADYIVIDLKRVIFYGDKGCNYVYGECIDKEILINFYKILKQIDLKYSKIFEFDDFYIYKKNEYESN
jgi:hypothetical protein